MTMTMFQSLPHSEMYSQTSRAELEQCWIIYWAQNVLFNLCQWRTFWLRKQKEKGLWHANSLTQWKGKEQHHIPASLINREAIVQKVITFSVRHRILIIDGAPSSDSSLHYHPLPAFKTRNWISLFTVTCQRPFRCQMDIHCKIIKGNLNRKAYRLNGKSNQTL